MVRSPVIQVSSMYTFLLQVMMRVSPWGRLVCATTIAGIARQEPIYSAYTGSRFSNEEIRAILDAKGIAYTQLSDEELYDQVTDCMIQGGVVGWMNGRQNLAHGHWVAVRSLLILVELMQRRSSI